MFLDELLTKKELDKTKIESFINFHFLEKLFRAFWSPRSRYVESESLQLLSFGKFCNILKDLKRFKHFKREKSLFDLEVFAF